MGWPNSEEKKSVCINLLLTSSLGIDLVLKHQIALANESSLDGASS